MPQVKKPVDRMVKVEIFSVTLKEIKVQAGRGANRVVWLSNFFGFLLFVFAPLCARADMTYADLQKLINQSTSLESLVPLLQKNGQTAGVTFMENSQSIQSSPPNEERAITYGQTAKLTVTFNGDPNNKTLEVMEYKPPVGDTAGHFELHEVSFSGSKPAYLPDSQIPAKCGFCHGAINPHPVFPDYPVWLGAAGENEDSIANDPKYKAFREAVAKDPHSRYAAVFKGHENDHVWPYYDKIKNEIYANMPNERFMALMGMYRSQQVAGIASKSELFSSLKYSLLYANLCEDGDSDGETIIDSAKKIMAQRAVIPPEEHWTGTRSAWLQEAAQDDGLLSYFDVPFGSTALAVRPTRGQASTTGLGSGVVPIDDDGDGDSGTYTNYQTDSYLIAEIAKHDAKLKAIMNANPFQYEFDAANPNNFLTSAPPGFLSTIEKQPWVGANFVDTACPYFKTMAAAEIKKINEAQSKCPNSGPNVGTSGAVVKNLQDIQNHVQKLTNADGKALLTSKGCIGCHDGSSTFPAPAFNFSQPGLFAKVNKEYNKKRVLTPGQAPPPTLLDKIKFQISDSAGQMQMPLQGEKLSPEEQTALLAYLTTLASAH